MEVYIKDAMTKHILEQAAQLFAIEASSIKHVGGFENFIYEFHKENQDVILRFVHSTHRSFSFVLAELEFIDYLSKNGANVSTVIPNIHEQIAVKIHTKEDEYFTLSAFSKAPGTHVKKDLIDEAFIQQFGEAVGKMHRLAKDFTPIHKRYHWHEETFVELGEKHLPPTLSFVVDKAKKLIQKIKQYSISREDYGLIHTDLHYGNMYYDNKTLTFFDFVDSAYKHYISDIAIILFYQFGITSDTNQLMEEKMINFLQHFLTGYNKENTISPIWFERLNDFLKLREIILIIVIHAAGEDMINSPFGQFYLNRFIPRTENDIDLVNVRNIIHGIH